MLSIHERRKKARNGRQAMPPLHFGKSLTLIFLGERKKKAAQNLHINRRDKCIKGKGGEPKAIASLTNPCLTIKGSTDVPNDE